MIIHSKEKNIEFMLEKITTYIDAQNRDNYELAQIFGEQQNILEEQKKIHNLIKEIQLQNQQIYIEMKEQRTIIENIYSKGN